MTDILSQIAGYKRVEVDERKALTSQAEMDARAAQASPPRGFKRALQAAHAPGRLALIGEIKKASPSRGLIRADFEPVALARAYEAGGAACPSSTMARITRMQSAPSARDSAICQGSSMKSLRKQGRATAARASAR